MSLKCYLLGHDEVAPNEYDTICGRCEATLWTWQKGPAFDVPPTLNLLGKWQYFRWQLKPQLFYASRCNCCKRWSIRLGPINRFADCDCIPF